MKVCCSAEELLSSCTWHLQADVWDRHNIWDTTGNSVQASEEQGVTPRQQQGPEGTAGRGKARGEAHRKGAGGRVGEDSLDMHFPKLFLSHIH